MQVSHVLLLLGAAKHLYLGLVFLGLVPYQVGVEAHFLAYCCFLSTILGLIKLEATP